MGPMWGAAAHATQGDAVWRSAVCCIGPVNGVAACLMVLVGHVGEGASCAQQHQVWHDLGMSAGVC